MIKNLPTKMTTEEIMKYHNKVKGEEFGDWLEVMWVRQ